MFSMSGAAFYRYELNQDVAPPTPKLHLLNGTVRMPQGILCSI
jgi:hypothetical protein